MKRIILVLILTIFSINSFAKESAKPSLKECEPTTIKLKKNCKYNLCKCEKEKNSCEKGLCPFPLHRKENS
jgi:hypothetical protein